jgi:HD superfamily phosphohydrolase
MQYTSSRQADSAPRRTILSGCLHGGTVILIKGWAFWLTGLIGPLIVNCIDFQKGAVDYFEMKYYDRIYGQVQIDEPLVVELLNSAAVGRLNDVMQHGVTGLIGLTVPTTRFDHSLGTMLLVERMGGGLEEQIAALLHDVSHTAFSHVIDYVFHGHETQNYHDAIMESYISSTDLPGLLSEYKYDWKRFIKVDTFSLLEQPPPALCADRIDYFLRDVLSLNIATDDEVDWALSHLATRKQRIVVDDLDAARWFGYAYISADKASWANFREVALYELTAMAIRKAMELGAIKEEDFWGGDIELWAKLQGNEDPFVSECVSLISTDTQFIWDDSEPDFWVSTKIRTIDPDVLTGTGVRRLSQLDGEFASVRDYYIERSRGKWPVRIARD